MEDITKTGPVGLKGLKGINQQNDAGLSDYSKLIRRASGSQLSQMFATEDDVPVGMTLAQSGYGNSKYDEVIDDLYQLENIGDVRAMEQSNLSKISAGLAKGAVLAGTTFLDGTLGLLVGGKKALDKGKWSGLWDNDFSKAMQSVNEWSEEALPNYYTEYERNNPLTWDSVFSANFLGDKLIKNLGFTIGAFYSGGLISGGVRGAGKLAIAGAKRLGAGIKTLKGISKSTSIVAAGLGAVTSAVNEGRIEALNNSKDWYNLHKLQIDDAFGVVDGDITHLSPDDLEDYNKSITRLNEDRAKMGNVDLLLNLPVLTFSNLVQFGKLFANGFKTAKKTARVAGTLGNYSAKMNKLKAATAITKGALAEGTEEVLQSAASRISGNYYSTDVNNFYKARIDPKASQETLDWVKSFAEGINETVNDRSAWEEFLIGTLTGALGMPRFRGMKNKEGGLQSPITLEGGAYNEWKDYSRQIARGQELADYMNNRVNSPEFKSYYQGINRHEKYQDDMNQSVEQGDEFEFKNAEHAQLVSDIVMFDEAGKIEDLKEAIIEASGISREDLESIVKNTTSKSEDGKLIGPFSQYATTDDEGNIIANFGTQKEVDKMASQIIKNRDEVLDTIDKYQTAKDEILLDSDGNLTDDQISELVWMKTQLGNWSDRAASMSGEIKSTIGTVIGSLHSALRFNQHIRDIGGQHNTGLTERYKQADENVRAIKKAINNLDVARSQDDKVLANTLSNNPEFVKALITEINRVDDAVLSENEKQKVIAKLNDIVKLGNASKIYNAKLKEYQENPQKQLEDHARADEQAAQRETKKKSDDLKTSLNAASTLRDFRAIIDSQDDTENRDKVLKEMEDEGNAMAKNYRETSQYNTEVRRVINGSDAEPQAKQDAMKLLQDQFNNSENLEQLANSNSIYINNENAFDEESEGDVELSATRFQNAQYELQKAISKVNNDNRFKDRFSPEYKKPVEKREGSTRGDDRGDTTGDSGTTTTPTVDTSTLPTTEVPVGNITQEMVAEENKKTNERIETPQRPSRDTLNQFYRPAIPELHIEGSKEGDFRPFDVIANEREAAKGVNFSPIYNYLRDSGAFRYVNEGNLKVGDELGFMIDPDYNENTIFLIDKRNGQIVGSLDESDYSTSRYEGLKGLEERIRSEYANRISQETTTKSTYDEIRNFIVEETIRYYRDELKSPLSEEAINTMRNTPLSGLYTTTAAKQLLTIPSFKERIDNFAKGKSSKAGGKFIATPTTKVSKMMVGRVPYGNTEKSLRDIPNVSGENRAPVFGIIKNGVLTTNGKVDDSLIIKPVDMAQKEGRLYLLIPNGAGKYSPAAVRVKHFNNEEFNLDDASVANTPMGKDISAAITKLANATSQDDVSQAMQDLAQDLYMQDVMVTWFDGRAGSGIVISKKVRKPDGTYEKVTINGKEQIKEDKYDVYFSTSKKSAEIGGINFDVTALEDLGDTSALGTPKDPNDIYKEILGHLTKFNLPLQVSTRRINNGAYNNRLINSGILTSNITDASVRSTWFTTDYFDNEGNLHQAVSPASVTPQPKRKIETPVGGTEGAITGTKITSVFSNKTYYVDLKTNTIRDDQGKSVKITNDNRILFDLAWAQDNFGSSTNSTVMVDNKVLTPSGQVLDRTTQKYITGQEAQDVKDAIAGRKKEMEDRVARSKEVISEIYENQKKVDKTRTDGEFYYVLEDDGQYHEYSRVHSRLGSNWVESPKQTEAFTQIRTKLSQLVNTPAQYSNYLKFLENKYKVNLEGYQGKTDAKSRDAIVNTVRDLMSGTNSMRALNAGTAVDSVIRQYFTIRDVSKIVRPDNMTENAFIDLITNLNRIKSHIEQMGERFLADNIVLFQKYQDGTRVAGEVDILSVDKDGNFKIYDVKTSKFSFYDFADRYGNKVNYFKNKSNTQRISNKDYYTLQLSAYKNLFESQYGVPVTKLAVMPFVLNYEKENVSGVQSEKGIPITYNPAVNVPLVGNVKVDKPIEAPATPAQEPPLLPIYDSSLELQNPIEDLAPEYSMNTGDDESVGYFEIDGKLHKGYMTRLTVVDGIPVEITKVPNITSGFGRQGETAHVASNSYYAVFPNGKTFLALKNNPVQGGYSQSQVEQAVSKMLEGNPQKVKELSAEKTILFDPNAVPTVNTAPITTVETPATINQSTTQTGAAYTAQKEQAVMEHDDEFEDEFTLRRVDETIEAPVWNQEKELNWLSRVLPQLSESDRVKVVKGLIKVGRQGALAWGQFDNGVITLSDIAAEGTTYHEAFHAVFNLLLDQSERQALYDEARRIYGEKDNLSLEEDMAEGFREYVMTRQSRGLGRRILDFFKELFTKVTNWNNFRPSLISYYQRINEGKYADSNFKVPTISELRGATPNTTTFNSLSGSIRESLTRKGWTAEKFDSISQDERDQAVKCIAF